MKRNPIIAASEHTEPDATKARGLERRFPNRLWADEGSAKPITNRRSGTLRLAMIWLFALALAGNVRAQVNSGSDGHDGAFNPATSTVIDMADHPDGIYQYTSVNIPTDVTVTFILNANNTPVVWLVQGNCVINGTVNVSGQDANGAGGSAGGPGGCGGGNGGSSATPGQGPGGGLPNTSSGTLGLNWAGIGGNASFGGVGGSRNRDYITQPAPGAIYGNIFILPLLGGSGGGGCSNGGAGGGAIRLVTRTLQGRGQITCSGGYCSLGGNSGGSGRIRLVRFYR